MIVQVVAAAVKQTCEKSTPAIRRWVIAWLETSTTACEQCALAIRASQCANRGADGVVSSASTESIESL